MEQLSPETAQLLFKKRWLSISLPALQSVTRETLRLMTQQTFRLNVGIPELTPELAYAFTVTPTDTSLGGGFILFPNVTELSPIAARILVKSPASLDLPRLRAATAEVIEILQLSDRQLYVLSED